MAWHCYLSCKDSGRKCPSSPQSCVSLSLCSTLRSTKWDLDMVQLPLISAPKNQASVLLLPELTSLLEKPWAMRRGWLSAGTLLELGRLGTLHHCSVLWVCAGGSEGCPRVCQPSGSLLLFQWFSQALAKRFCLQRTKSEQEKGICGGAWCGIPFTCCLALVCVATAAPLRQTSGNFLPIPSALWKHHKTSLAFFTLAYKRKNTCKPQSLMTHHKHETIAQGAETPPAHIPWGLSTHPQRDDEHILIAWRSPGASCHQSCPSAHVDGSSTVFPARLQLVASPYPPLGLDCVPSDPLCGTQALEHLWALAQCQLSELQVDPHTPLLVRTLSADSLWCSS